MGLRAGLAAALREAAPGGRLLDGARALWRGTGATLARDVPFSALYWAAMEPMRSALLVADAGRGPDDMWRTFRANILAGSAAGALAATLTTPLDVVKTRRQICTPKLEAAASKACPQSTLSLLRGAAAEKGLFVGALPRALRAAPACAIVLASYELLKLA